MGSAIVLGLLKGRVDAKPTTSYLLTYRAGKCDANCGFCPQAKMSQSRANMLSRVVWPPFDTTEVIAKIERSAKSGMIQRICLQALNYPTVFDDTLGVVKEIRSRTRLPISISFQPISLEKLTMLKEAGVERISIALDAATEELFKQIKGERVGGPYVWKKQREALKEAVTIFGDGFVTTHLIVGLGEREKEIVQTIQWCVDEGIYPSLFAFTPVPGTPLEQKSQPSLVRYRRVQLTQYLITRGNTRYNKMAFDDAGDLIEFGLSKEKVTEIIETGDPFLTSGCPGCNRPFYNERPLGPIYNYPRTVSRKELADIKKRIGLL